MLNRYVKVEGHKNWFLVLDKNTKEPNGLSETMQERILRSEVCSLHNDTEEARKDQLHRIRIVATRDLNYERLAEKYGTILIRPIGSFMPLVGNTIINETFDSHFPINDFSDIVICENDRVAEYKWIKYLNYRFPNKKIVTINFFDLRNESEIEVYLNNAKYITFSTTFSSFDWFKKLTKFTTNEHKIIGYCHDSEKWETAKKINPNIEIINNI